MVVFSNTCKGRAQSETSDRRANEGKNRVFQPISLALTYRLFVKKPA